MRLAFVLFAFVLSSCFCSNLFETLPPELIPHFITWYCKENDSNSLQILSQVSTQWKKRVIKFVSDPENYDDSVRAAIVEMIDTWELVPKANLDEFLPHFQKKSASLKRKPAEAILVAIPSKLHKSITIRYNEWPIDGMKFFLISSIAFYFGVFSVSLQYCEREYTLYGKFLNSSNFWRNSVSCALLFRSVSFNKLNSARSIQEMLHSERFMSQAFTQFGVAALTRVIIDGSLGHTPLMGLKALKWIVLAIANLAISRNTRLTSWGQGIRAVIASVIFVALR